MPGFLANAALEPNAIEQKRQQRLADGLSLIDLTDSNPTTQGYLFPPEVLLAESKRYFDSRCYRPDPRGSLKAREAICQYYTTRTPALQLNPEHIFLTASTSESYMLLFTLLCDPGDNVLGPSITYPLFDLLAETRPLTIRPYRLIEGSAAWSIDTESLLRAQDKQSRAVMLISPHNPTGQVISQRVEDLVSLNLPLICDEVFADFCWTRPSAPPLGAFYPDLPVFHLNGLSKSLALPDLKLGWIALNELAAKCYGERLEFLNDSFLSCNSLSQALLPALLEKSLAFRESYKSSVKANLDFTLSLLRTLPEVQVHAPAGGPFLFPQISTSLHEEDLVLKLIDAGVYTHPGFFYGCRESVHLFISAYLPQLTLSAAIAQLHRILLSAP